MAKRERFVTPLTCPQCALNGSTTWEEDEGGVLETTIKSVSHGFVIGPGTEIYYDGCGVTATFGRTLSRSEMMTATTLSGQTGRPNVAVAFGGNSVR
jgi:hypothetical protein